MARPRSFDETELLDTVMTAFWRHGYSATTFRSLERLSGVGVKSLVNTFGEKDELFTKALACYRIFVTDNVAMMFDPPSVEAIIGLFERVSSPAASDDPRNAGCLMVNTVFEIDQPLDGIAHEISLYRELFRGAFHDALKADNVRDPENRAEFLVGALWGALSQIRLTHDTTSAKPMSTIVIETIRGWTRDD